jgi:ribosomal-protein-alanine N-acetyltransferase
MIEEPESLGVRLRAMALSDIDAVLQIEKASFSTPWPRRAYLYDLARPGRSICLVCECIQSNGDAVIVGDIVVWLAGEIAHIATLAVHPHHRRQGIGACLLAEGLLASIERGMNAALLEVREENLGAQALYLKFGFEVVGIRQGYYEDTGEDAVLMALKPLSRDQLAEFTKCG